MALMKGMRSRIRIEICIDNNLHERGGLSLDLNPVCLRVNTTNLYQDQNPRVNGAYDNCMVPSDYLCHTIM